MPSALSDAHRERTRLSRTRQRLLKLSTGFAIVAALLPATASAFKTHGPAHNPIRPTSPSTHARQLSDATIVEYGLPASEWL